MLLIKVLYPLPFKGLELYQLGVHTRGKKELAALTSKRLRVLLIGCSWRAGRCIKTLRCMQL